MINEDGIKYEVAKALFIQKVSDAGLVVPAERTAKFDQIEADAHVESTDTAQALIDDYKAKAYQILKTEINVDPLSIGYAGKTDQEIADLLNIPRQKVEDTESFVPSRLQVVVGVFLNSLIKRPDDLAINIDGKIFSAAPGLQEDLDARIQAEIDNDPTGVGYDKMDAAAQREALKRASIQMLPQTINLHPRLMDIFIGIPYVLNVVTADDVTAARSS